MNHTPNRDEMGFVDEGQQEKFMNGQWTNLWPAGTGNVHDLICLTNNSSTIWGFMRRQQRRFSCRTDSQLLSSWSEGCSDLALGSHILQEANGLPVYIYLHIEWVFFCHVVYFALHSPLFLRLWNFVASGKEMSWIRILAPKPQHLHFRSTVRRRRCYRMRVFPCRMWA